MAEQWSAYLEDRVVPHGPLGLAAVEDLILAGELIISRILACHHPPAPLLLAFRHHTGLTKPHNHSVHLRTCKDGLIAWLTHRRTSHYMGQRRLKGKSTRTQEKNTSTSHALSAIR